MKKFTEWLKNRLIIESEAKRLRLRPELDDSNVRKFEVSIGDIVELGPETQYKGEKITRIGRVVEVRANEIVVADLTQLGKRIVIPMSEIYDKEELRGARIIPRDEKQLMAMNAKRLWVRLTPRQYKKFAASYRHKPVEIVPMQRDDGPSDSLRKMFSSDSTEKKPEEILSMFRDKKDHGSSPLRRFVQSKKGLEGMFRTDN